MKRELSNMTREWEKDKSASKIGIEPVTSRTRGGRSIHWATRTHGDKAIYHKNKLEVKEKNSSMYVNALQKWAIKLQDHSVQCPIKQQQKNILDKNQRKRASTGFELLASANTGAMLYQLNYEALAIHTLGAPPMRGWKKELKNYQF